jgi:F-type H+-transporting ATPase subunit epsilon
MAEELQLEIVTPRGVMLTEKVTELVAPGSRGEFGVLPGHLPMLAALHVGLLHYRKGKEMVDVAVGNGFAEVLDDKALVLTDRFITRKSAKEDVLGVRKRLKDVDAKLERWDGEIDDPERLDLIEEEQWLAAQLELIGDPPPPRVLEVRAVADFSQILPELDDEGDDASEED